MQAEFLSKVLISLDNVITIDDWDVCSAAGHGYDNRLKFGEGAQGVAHHHAEPPQVSWLWSYSTGNWARWLHRVFVPQHLAACRDKAVGGAHHQESQAPSQADLPHPPLHQCCSPCTSSLPLFMRVLRLRKWALLWAQGLYIESRSTSPKAYVADDMAAGVKNGL